MFASIVLVLAGATRVDEAAVAAPDEYVITGRFVLPTAATVPAVRRDRVFGRVDWSHGNFGKDGSQEIEWSLAPDGSFRETFPRERSSVVLEFWFEVRDELGGFETGLHVGMPVDEATGESASDRVELGELAFPSSRTIAAGRVTDRTGAPIAGALVGLTPEQEAPDLRNGLDHHRLPTQDLRIVRAFTATDGSIRLRSPFPVEECQLLIHADGFFWQHAPIRPGASAVVPLIRTARIAGRVEFAKSEQQESLLVEAEPSVRTPDAESEDAPIDPDGSFVIDGLRAGTYDVVVRVRGTEEFSPEIVAELDDVVVAEGAIVRDPRLDKLSFLRRTRAMRVRIDVPREKKDDDDPDSEPILPSGEIFGLDARGNRTVWWAELRDGEARVRPLVDVQSLELRVDGFRNERVADLSRDATVKLRPGIQVKVVVLPENLPCLLCSSLTDVRERKRWFRSSGVVAHDNDEWFAVYCGPTDTIPPGLGTDGGEGASPPTGSEGDASADSTIDEPEPSTRPDFHPGILYFSLGDPGRFELRLFDQRHDTLIAIPRESATIEVKDSSELQTFEIHLDADEVRSLQKE